MPKKQKLGGGKGTRKYGRNKDKCLKYFNEKRRIENKTKKLKKSIKNIKKETQIKVLTKNKIGRKREQRESNEIK